MATESFYEDMIIDTPEKAKALEDVLENGEPYRIKYPDISYDDPEIIRRFKENYRRERQIDIPDGTASDDSTCLRPRSRTVGRPSVRSRYGDGALEPAFPPNSLAGDAFY